MSDIAYAMSELEKLTDGTRLLPGPQFYENQVTAAKEAIQHFTERKPYVLLSAQMQSGKTGCSLYVAFKMLIEKRVENVFIISGSHETVLRQQWVEEIPAHLFSFCQEHGIDDEEVITRYGEQLINNVFFRQDLVNNLDKFTSKYLVIWDESHYAIQEGSQLHRFYVEIGIWSALQGDTSCLEEKGSYVLSVTATRGAEQSRKIGANNKAPVESWGTVVLTPGKGYRGVQEIKSLGLIHPSVPIDEDNIHHFRQIISKYYDTRKYIIVRTTEARESLIERLRGDDDRTAPFDIIKFNMGTKKIKKRGDTCVNVSILRKSPKRLTLFFVRQMLRMGKQLPKKNICAVYEHCDEQNYDTGLQSLLGRSCGYNIPNLIDVYMDDGAENKALNNYIDIIESGFSQPIARTQNIRDRKLRKIKSRAKKLYPNAPHLIRVTEDEYRLTNDTLATNYAVRSVMKELSQILLDMNIHRDPKYSSEQQQEILGLLNTSRVSGFQSDFSTTHKTHDVSTRQVLDSISKDPGGCMLQQLGNALQSEEAIKSTRTIEKQLVIYRVNGSSGLEDTGLQKGDFVVIFNTEAKSRFEPPTTKSKFATNEKDVFHTTRMVCPLAVERDGDGSNTCLMPSGAKNNPEELKKYIRQFLRDYLAFKSGERDVATKPYISTRNVLFSREVYKNAAYMKGIIKSLSSETEFKGKIQVEASFRRGPGPIRCEIIKWF